MAPHTSQDLPPDQATTTSRYWNTPKGTEGPAFPWLKKINPEWSATARELAEAASEPQADELPCPPDPHQFKRKFDDAFRFKKLMAAGIKEEPQYNDDDDSASKTSKVTKHFFATKANQPYISTKSTTPVSRTSETTHTSDVTTNDSQERSALVATLALVGDSAVTAAAVALVLRWARQFASSRHGDIYDTRFIQGIIADLDAHGIEPERRAVIAAMLARPLQQQLESLRSSSESLQSCLASITTPQPSSPLSKRSSE